MNKWTHIILDVKAEIIIFLSFFSSKIPEIYSNFILYFIQKSKAIVNTWNISHSSGHQKHVCQTQKSHLKSFPSQMLFWFCYNVNIHHWRHFHHSISRSSNIELHFLSQNCLMTLFHQKSTPCFFTSYTRIEYQTNSLSTALYINYWQSPQLYEGHCQHSSCNFATIIMIIIIIFLLVYFYKTLLVTGFIL